MSGQRAKLKGALWLVLACALAFAATTNFSDMVRWIPFSAETRMAATMHLGLDKNSCSGGEGRRALKKMLDRIYPLEEGDAQFQITVKVVPNSEVNAYATLGGLVYINQGLLAQAESPEELAGVLAHEIEHVRRRHILENVIVSLGTYVTLQMLMGDSPSGVDIAQTILGLQYGKKQESEADRGGLERLVEAEVDVRGFQSFFQRMQKYSHKLEFLSDHPSDASRAERAEEYLGRNSRPVLDAAEWSTLRNICRRA